MRVFIDTDVLIWHLRGEPKARGFLRGLTDEGPVELWIGAVQRAEIVFFMPSGEEDQTMLFLSRFRTAPVDQGVVDEAGRFYREWNKSHGTDVNDALLAATARRAGGMIYTLNRKHYPMPDVVVKKAW